MKVQTVRGWRRYAITLCNSDEGDQVLRHEPTQQWVLAGALNLHLHSYPPPMAICTKDRTHVAPHYPCEKDCCGTYCCFTAGTRVLMRDLTWRPIETIEEGEEVIAFHQERLPIGTVIAIRERLAGGRRNVNASAYPIVVTPRSTRWIINAKVTKVFRHISPIVRVRFSGGRTLYPTPDHQFLTRPDTHKVYKWQAAQALMPGNLAALLVSPWEAAKSWQAGWLAGMYDGEGTVDTGGYFGNRRPWSRIGLAQKAGPTADRIAQALLAAGFDYSASCHSGVMRFNIRGGLSEELRFAGQIRPPRLLDALNPQVWGVLRVKGPSCIVEEVTPMKKAEVVYNLQTTAGTFFAEGLGVSNCGYYATYVPQRESVVYVVAPTVWAAVEAIGKIVLAEEGFRTEAFIIKRFYWPAQECQGKEPMADDQVIIHTTWAHFMGGYPYHAPPDEYTRFARLGDILPEIVEALGLPLERQTVWAAMDGGGPTH